MTWLRQAGLPTVAQAGVVVLLLATFVVDVPLVAHVLPGCISLQVSTSVERGKEGVLAEVADEFSDTHSVDGRCVEVSVEGTSSGVAEQALERGWDIDGAPEPQVWLPTSSMWVDLLRESGTVDRLPSDPPSISSSVLVLAMPESLAVDLAEHLDLPDERISWDQLRDLIRDGWPAAVDPDQSDFDFGKDNPHLSTSGLAATVAAFYGAADSLDLRPDELRLEDLDRRETRGFIQEIEAGARYKDDVIYFLEDLAVRDASDTLSAEASTVVMQEQLVYEYNQGRYSADRRTPPHEPLRTFYLVESTLWLDHPFVVLPSASAAQRDAAQGFYEFLREPARQQALADVGFRSGARELDAGTLDADVAEAISGRPEVPEGVSLVQPPSGQLLDGMLDVWDDVREPANILLLLDTSSSMGDPTSDGSSTRMERMQSAAAEGVHRLVHLSHDVGLWTFPGSEGRPYDEAVPLGSLTNTQEDEIEEAIGELRRAGPTPLYRAIQGAQDELLRYAAGQGPAGEAARVNAVVVLTDGGNSDPGNDDPQTADVETFVREVLIPAQGDTRAEKVAVFTIAFDFDDPAAYDALGRISDATDGVRYDARDPEALADVFVEVLSSF